MLSPDLIAQIRKIQIRAGHLVTDALSGEYTSAFKGQGMEFDEVREYVPGDDIRAIDWNVTARMNAPFIKVFREEREQTLMLMVDVSPSQSFGSKQRTKNELSAEFAAVLAFLATRNNDKIGLIVFSDHVERFIPPKKGRGHVWNIIRTVLTHEGKGTGTNIKQAVEFMSRVVRRRSMCFIISDFMDTGFEKSIFAAKKRHDVICVKTFDEREFSLPEVGLIDFIDCETGKRILFDSSKKGLNNFMTAHVQSKWETLQYTLRKQKIDALELATSRDFVGALENFLKRREKKRR